MDVNSAFPSKFLKAADLQGRKVRAVISQVEMDKIGDDTRMVAYFQGKEKGLVVNKTNANTIADMFGPETDDWAGREIVLFPTRVDYQGKRVDAIRVEFNQPPPRTQQSRMPAEAAQNEQQMRRPAPSATQQHDERNPPDDEIPF